MTRRLILGFIVFGFLGSFLLIYFFVKKQQNTETKPLIAVPVNAAFIAQIKNPHEYSVELREKSKFIIELLKLPRVEFLDSGYIVLDTIIKSNESFRKLFSQNTITVSFHEIGNNTYSPLLIVPINGNISGNTVISAVEKEASKWGTVTYDKYLNTRIYTFLRKSNAFYYALNNGLLLSSSSKILLQDALRQFDVDVNLLTDSSFLKVIETTGQQSQINLFIQLKQFTKFSHQVISEQYLNSLGIQNIGDWMELDLNFKNQTVLFNGFATANNYQNNFMNLFQGQSPQPVDFLKMIPPGVESFMGFSLSNFSEYNRNLQKYMVNIDEKARYETNQTWITESFGKNTIDDFEQVFDRELVYATLSDNTHLFFIKTLGNLSATEWITRMLETYSNQHNQKIESLKKVYTIDSGAQFTIYQMPVNFLPTRIFGPWFKGAEANYVAVYNDYIIFGDTFDALSKTIYSLVLQKNLAFNPYFSDFSDYLSNSVNFFSFISFTGSGNALESILEEKAFNYFKTNQSAISNFYGMAWQFAAESNLYYNNLVFYYQPSNSQNPTTEWETRLDTIIAFKPEMVINHQTRQKEIFVQDAKNNIYLINNLGRILWKKQLDEPIMGEVVQVDYYKNGKLQYLFNTKSKLHLIDRNGNMVERYPIKLGAEAVTALSIFDYENNKNYRIFVPLVNNKVELYSIDGKVITGFTFEGSDQKIIAPVQHITDNHKDYIIITDESRIYILDRQGNIRVKLQTQFKASANNTFAYQPGNNNRPGRLVRTDVNGTIYYIYFDGKVETKELHACSSEHFFNVVDITGDRINDFIFVDGKEVTVYSLTGQKIYSHTFSTRIQHSPSFYKFAANKTYMGITESESRKIYLFDNDGQIAEIFPLIGKTRFSIGYLGNDNSHYNLVVGGDEYYLYNYKLN